MSTGELTVIPEIIYVTKEKLKRHPKRSPTDQELATALKMSPSALTKLKHVKVKYNETTLTPSLAASRGAVAYRHAKPWSKNIGGIGLLAVLSTIAMVVEKEKDVAPGTKRRV
jgi:hypothetical protein